jgi:hypothetical protein
LGRSYWAELPKYRFEQTAIEVGKGLPGSRLIRSFKSRDLDSPISWFWPATTTWNFAMPDPVMGDRFYTMTLVYGEKEPPSVYLVDADCKDHEFTWYDLDEPASAIPARDLYGEPVQAPNGETYRLSKPQLDPPPGWMHEFCDTDWTAERKAERKAASQ